jgi:hypothetical protein
MWSSATIIGPPRCCFRQQQQILLLQLPLHQQHRYLSFYRGSQFLLRLSQDKSRGRTMATIKRSSPGSHPLVLYRQQSAHYNLCDPQTGYRLPKAHWVMSIAIPSSKQPFEVRCLVLACLGLLGSGSRILSTFCHTSAPPPSDNIFFSHVFFY